MTHWDLITRLENASPSSSLGFPAGSDGKNPPAVQGTQVWSLGLEDSLEKGMVTQSSWFLPGEIHGQRSLAGYSLSGCKELDMTEWLTLFPLITTSVLVWKTMDYS